MTLTLHETAMEIRFCDLCHESIPDADFETGRAVAIDGRTMCVACGLRRSLSLTGPRAWLTLLLALYAAGVATWLLTRDRGPTGVSASVAAAIKAQADQTLADATQSQGEAAGNVQKLLESADARTNQASEAITQQIRALVTKVDQDREETSARLSDLEARMRALDAQVSEVHGWLKELKDRAEREVTQPVEPPPTPEPPAEPIPGPPPTTPAPTNPREPAPTPQVDPAQLQHWIDLLQDPDAGIAFTATISLARLKDLRAVPALIRALETYKDFYVRLGAADALRELRACDAVPNLIDALDDKDDLVRSSANLALQGITQHEEPFAPTLGKPELRKVQKNWRDWWKENESRVRVSLNQEKPR
jgi:polyhydroxyalkanoate synthesis regulator phasin